MTTLSERSAEFNAFHATVLAEWAWLTPELYDHVASRAEEATPESREQVLAGCVAAFPRCPNIVSHVFALHFGKPSAASIVDVRSLFTSLPRPVRIIGYDIDAAIDDGHRKGILTASEPPPDDDGQGSPPAASLSSCSHQGTTWTPSGPPTGGAWTCDDCGQLVPDSTVLARWETEKANL